MVAYPTENQADMDNLISEMRSRLSADQPAHAANAQILKRKSSLAKIGACCLGAMFAFYIVSVQEQTSTSRHDAGGHDTSTISALDKMAVVFKGGYARDQIDSVLSRVMTQFGEPLTEANYNRWGSILIRMRKESTVPEMEILACMKEMLAQFEMGPAAALCAAARKHGL
jgi:hypothetical protein